MTPPKSSKRRREKRETHSKDGVMVRVCRGIEEFEACIKVEKAVWGSADIDVVPPPVFVVASETGGQVLGAFSEGGIVGFTLAIAGWRGRRPFLHSHMTAVLESHRDFGIGRSLKLLQREDALARGIRLIEWTFDPLVTKNAYFNLMRLGAISRRYLPNAYGITTSPLHGSLPTDRLVAEWHLRSRRVQRILVGKRPTAMFSKRAAKIFVPVEIEEWKRKDPGKATRIQSRIRAQFEKWFEKGYAATAVASNPAGTNYILEPWKEL